MKKLIIFTVLTLVSINTAYATSRPIKEAPYAKELRWFHDDAEKECKENGGVKSLTILAAVRNTYYAAEAVCMNGNSATIELTVVPEPTKAKN